MRKPLSFEKGGRLIDYSRRPSRVPRSHIVAYGVPLQGIGTGGTLWIVDERPGDAICTIGRWGASPRSRRHPTAENIYPAECRISGRRGCEQKNPKVLGNASGCQPPTIADFMGENDKATAQHALAVEVQQRAVGGRRGGYADVAHRRRWQRRSCASGRDRPCVATQSRSPSLGAP